MTAARRALVTGGGGFLGGAIVRLLRARGETVLSFARGTYPELTTAGVEEQRGDLADPGAVLAATEGCDIIYHVAARAGIWGRWSDFHRPNVIGTQNVLDACREHGIRRLVYTSSPSVVFKGRDMEGVDESVAYSSHFHAHYPHTKMMAERAILAANSGKLATVALRPHLIWGPGDRHLVPRILERGRAGQLRRLGREEKLVDSVFIDDAAAAHLAAGDRLEPGSTISGKAYFISQGEPKPLWDLINGILAAGGVPPVERSISPRVAYAAGCILEAAYKLLRRPDEPRMTRFLARELSTAHWFDISAARRDLGYEPRHTIAEGLQKLAESLHEETSVEDGTSTSDLISTPRPGGSRS